MASRLYQTALTVSVIVSLVALASAIECSDGYFGDDCSGICHCNVTGDICDKFTGHCQFGCADGWQGAICQDKIHTESDSSTISVMGVSVGIAVTSLIMTVAAIFCCFSRHQRILTRKRMAREEQRGQRSGRLQEFFHNYNSSHRSDRRNPFRVVPFSHKLETHFPNQHYGPPPKYPGTAAALATHLDILPPHSESPPPSYEESMVTDAQRHANATRRQSREMLISGRTGNSFNEIWTIT